MCSLPTVPVAQDGSEWDVLPTGWGSKGPKVPLRGIANANDRPKMQKWGTMSRDRCDHSLASKEYPTLRPNRIKPKAFHASLSCWRPRADGQHQGLESCTFPTPETERVPPVCARLFLKVSPEKGGQGHH